MRPTHQRFGEYDVVERWSPYVPRALIQPAFGLSCTAMLILARLVVDLVAPTAGPFALIYPTTLIATLYGRWQAGAVTLISSFLYAWWFVLPDAQSFHFANPADAARTAVNGAAATVIVVFAEVFRRAVRRAARERDNQIVARDLLLREIDHRMKNNFMIVASLLDLQRRRHENPETREALQAAAARVHSFAAAHQALYADAEAVHAVSMAEYLKTLADNVAAALFLPNHIRLQLRADDVRMPHDQAVSIGLVLNEAVTNAAKHAFGPDDQGLISIEFAVDADGWRLVVADNGRGAPSGVGGSGLGSSLIESFAQRAGGQVVTERLERGTRVVLTSGAA